MRRHAGLRIGILVTVLALVALAGPAIAHAAGGPVPVTGGVFTTVDTKIDGTGHCKNGNPSVNCNIYDGKAFVWLNGGPGANKLGSDGTYFFAVLSPGGQSDPNDGSANNLSDDYDCWQNRKFTIVNGEVGAYTPTSCSSYPHGPVAHTFDKPFIRLYPYGDTTNNGGVYIMAICRVPTTPRTTNGPGVDPKSCKYDAYKVPTNDTTGPSCNASVLTNAQGVKYVQITVQDPQSGIETITPTGTNVTVSLPTWNVGTLSSLVVTGTQIDPYAAAALSVVVTNVAGLSSTCGASIPPKQDTVQPLCLLTAVINGPPKQIQVTVQDPETGIQSIVAQVTNATAPVSFTPGTKNPVVVTGTKIKPGKGSTLKLTVTDGAGNVTVCDPVFGARTTTRAAALDARHALVLAHVSGSTTMLALRKETSGTLAIAVWVNGHRLRVNVQGTKTRYVDVSRWLHPGMNNRVVVKQLSGVRTWLRASLYD